MELLWFSNTRVSGISEKVNGSPEKVPHSLRSMMMNRNN